MSSRTGFYGFLPEDTGYAELRRLFDYLREVKQTGPNITCQERKNHSTEDDIDKSKFDICVIDAEDFAEGF
jgi:DNA repair and recombination protein RAD54B